MIYEKPLLSFEKRITLNGIQNGQNLTKLPNPKFLFIMAHSGLFPSSLQFPGKPPVSNDTEPHQKAHQVTLSLGHLHPVRLCINFTRSLKTKNNKVLRI
jgi:hypothetical protein